LIELIPDDEQMSVRNMKSFGINIYKKNKKNCALSWSLTRIENE
jgi:hypothetical protein